MGYRFQAHESVDQEFAILQRISDPHMFGNVNLSSRARVALLCAIPLISLLLHWNVFSLELTGIHVTRQSQTYQNILNFHRYDGNILNPRIHTLNDSLQPALMRMDFPILQWMVAHVFSITGESYPATRIMMFLLGLLTICGIYFMLRQILGGFFIPWAGAWAFTFSPVFYYYTTAAMPDNMSVCAIGWMVGFFFRWYKTRHVADLILSAFLLSLAAACKLPYIVYGALPAAFVVMSAFHKKFNRLQPEFLVAIVFLAFMAPTLAWYAWVIPTWSNGVIAGITDNQAPTEQIVHYIRHHLTVMFPSRLMNTAGVVFFGLGIIFSIRRRIWRKPEFFWLSGVIVLLLIYVVYELNMIADVHDYYMMPFLPVLYLVIPFGLQSFWLSGTWARPVSILLLAIMPWLTYTSTKFDWSTRFASHWVLDHRETIREIIPPTDRVIVINDNTWYLSLGAIDRYGYIFWDDHLPHEWIKDMRDRCDVRWMISNSRAVDTTQSVRQYFLETRFDHNGVKVIRLK